MAKHTYFEELCALAPLGGLTASQGRELDAHMLDCSECRQAMMDYDRLYRHLVPEANDTDERFIESRRSDVRASVMRGVVAIDTERERLPVGSNKDGLRLQSDSSASSRAIFWLVAGGGLAAVSLALAAFWIGAHVYAGAQQHGSAAAGLGSVRPQTAYLPAATPKVVAVNPSPQGDTKDGQLIAALSAERQRNVELADKLTVEDGELAKAIAAQDALREQIDQQSALVKATQAELEAKSAALEQAQSAKSADAATVAGLQYQVHDLSDKLHTQNASLDRERDLLSHNREIRDIIGARNLHIIDVYDTDTGGATKKAFARAFYTEGKSLVYYAYDLPQKKADEGRFSYVAWGETNGNKASIKKIGLLFHDDQTQRRWSLNFANPEVLAEIDSVFITLERADEDVSQPKGKRLLTAYLGTPPNHP